MHSSGQELSFFYEVTQPKSCYKQTQYLAGRVYFSFRKGYLIIFTIKNFFLQVQVFVLLHVQIH